MCTRRSHRYLPAAALVWLGATGLVGVDCQPQSPPEAGSTWTATGAFCPWPADRTLDIEAVAASTDGRHVAVRAGGDAPYLTVWRLSPAGELTERILQTDPRDYLAMCFCWCGGTLVYTRVTGTTNLHELDMSSPPGGYPGFIARHAETVAWDPQSGDCVGSISGGSRVLLGHPDGATLSALDSYARRARKSRDDEAPDGTVDVSLYSAPGLALVSTGKIGIGNGVSEGGLPRVVCRTPDGSGYFIHLSRNATSRAESGHSMFGTIWLLAFAWSTGDLREISHSPGEDEIAQSTSLDVPLIWPVGEGEQVAAVLEGSKGPPGLGIFGPKGLVRRYDFSVRSMCPVALARTGDRRWAPIACTTDGTHMLFQQTRTLRDGDDSPQSQYWVWLWNLQADRGVPVAQLGEVVQCFGWAGSDRLLVGTVAQPRAEGDLRPPGIQYGAIQLGHLGR